MKKLPLNPNFLNLIILALLGAGLLRLSWQKWANIAEDYGRELYTPWRISCGQVLYKDITSLFGPFPPYWNAMLFKIFGVSIMTLELFNILLVAGITILIYKFFTYTMDRGVAFFTSAAFLSLLAFRQSGLYPDQGNYAYICPYTYSVTYAVFMSLGAMYLFVLHGRLGRDILLGVLGVLIGLTILCRLEIFVFLAIALLAGFLVKGIIGRWTAQQFLKAGGLILGGFSVPVGIAYLYFSTQLLKSQIWPSIFGFNDRWYEMANDRYYMFMNGLDHPGHNFIIMLTTAACYFLVIVVLKFLCMWADYLERNGKRWEVAVIVLLAMAVLVGICFGVIYDHYDEIFKGLPVVVILMLGHLSLLLWRHQKDEEKIRRLLALWVMTVWGLLMLTKVFFRTQIKIEGFVYAMPAIMLFIVFFKGFLPQHFERAHKRGYFVRPLISVLIVLILMVGLNFIIYDYQFRSSYIRTKSGTIICNRVSDPEIGEISAFLKNVNRIMGKDANFVAFPDGVMLNFLTKRINPLPYIIFKFAETRTFGEQKIIRSFKEHKPDYVVMSNRAWFPNNHDPRSEYPRAIREWILDNYHPVWSAHPGMENMITVYKRSG